MSLMYIYLETRVLLDLFKFMGFNVGHANGPAEGLEALKLENVK